MSQGFQEQVDITFAYDVVVLTRLLKNLLSGS